MSDPLVRLASNDSIAHSTAEAVKALDALAWNRDLRNFRAEYEALALRTSGYATGALDGAIMPEDVSSDPESSPMGELSAKALIVTAEAMQQIQAFKSSPIQVWARLHSLLTDSDDRGKLRTTDDVDDPLHLGALVPASYVEGRIRDLNELIINSSAPALLVGAIAQAEISTVRPFAYGSHIVARATSRLVLASRGVDVSGLGVLEAGMYSIGRATYTRALGQYMSGTAEGVAGWVAWYCDATIRGTELASNTINSMKSA